MLYVYHGSVIVYLQDIAARRREMVEKERRRRAEAAAKRSEDVRQQHQKLVEKQKQDRINRGREQWRNNLLGELLYNHMQGVVSIRHLNTI